MRMGYYRDRVCVCVLVGSTFRETRNQTHDCLLYPTWSIRFLQTLETHFYDRLLISDSFFGHLQFSCIYDVIPPTNQLTNHDVVVNGTKMQRAYTNRESAIYHVHIIHSIQRIQNKTWYYPHSSDGCVSWQSLQDSYLLHFVLVRPTRSFWYGTRM